MTGQEAVDYIHSARGRGKKDGLRKITELMHRLGDPQDKLRYVHVVGTNGKGSTTSMIAHSSQRRGTERECSFRRLSSISGNGCRLTAR